MDLMCDYVLRLFCKHQATVNLYSMENGRKHRKKDEIHKRQL